MEIIAIPRGHLIEVAYYSRGISASSSPDFHETLELPALATWLTNTKVTTWIWPRTDHIYAALLKCGITVHRCVDLRLRGKILALNQWASISNPGEFPTWLQGPIPEPISPNAPQESALFEVPSTPEAEPSVQQVREEYLRQSKQIAAATGRQGQKLKLLLAAECTGALIAAEIHEQGLPWDRTRHEQILQQILGPRPAAGYRPAKMAALATDIATKLGQSKAAAAQFNPDSHPTLLTALRKAGIEVASTSKWELAEHSHPAIAPLLEYKKLARLLSAHGWEWLDTWVDQTPPAPTPTSPTPLTRFRPDYVPAGVVTGRWATRGGGAMQIPVTIRDAVRADPGWELIIADASQIEPRVLAAMSADYALAKAGQGDLYDGLVTDGVAPSRAEAKVGMLGALYGATTGASGELMRTLTRAYPRAVAAVEAAARLGEQGGQVHTWLGRFSPLPSQQWQRIVDQGHDSPSQGTAAGRAQRDHGRFTRNFIVQGSAAEWALVWMATIRRELNKGEYGGAYLAYFLHDEVIVHAPETSAHKVAQLVRDCASEAGKILFGNFPIEFPISLRSTTTYGGEK